MRIYKKYLPIVASIIILGALLAYIGNTAAKPLKAVGNIASIPAEVITEVFEANNLLLEAALNASEDFVSLEFTQTVEHPFSVKEVLEGPVYSESTLSLSSRSRVLSGSKKFERRFVPDDHYIVEPTSFISIAIQPADGLRAEFYSDQNLLVVWLPEAKLFGTFATEPINIRPDKAFTTNVGEVFVGEDGEFQKQTAKDALNLARYLGGQDKELLLHASCEGANSLRSIYEGLIADMDVEAEIVILKTQFGNQPASEVAFKQSCVALDEHNEAKLLSQAELDKLNLFAEQQNGFGEEFIGKELPSASESDIDFNDVYSDK